MTPPQEAPPVLPTTGAGHDPVGSERSRWRTWRGPALLVLAALAAAGWRYRVTRPDYRLARGEEAVQAGNWDSADRLADRLQAAGHPDHAHFLRAELRYRQRSPGVALEECNQIRAAGPLGLRAAALSGKCLVDLGELREAHRVLSFVVDKQPDNADAHRGLASIAYDLGQMGDAVAHLEEVARLDPHDARPHRLIGLIYKDTDQPEKAAAAYREALGRGLAASADAETRLELAEVLVRETRFAEALEVLDAVPENGADPAHLVVRAECLRGVGRRQDAADLIDRVRAEDRTVLAHRLRGQLYIDEGRYAEAVRSLERAVERDPTEYQSTYLLAQTYAGAGRKDDAVRAAARAEELRRDLDRITQLSQDAMARPWDPAVRLELAGVCDRLGRSKLAAMWRSAAEVCAGRKAGEMPPPGP